MAATVTKDLWSGRPVWLSYPAPRIPCEKMTQDVKADIAIIGAGICGAMVAEELSRMGFSIVMLDRRMPLRGSTAASTALLQYEIDMPLLQMRRRIGADKSARAWRRSRLSLENLWARLGELKIPCSKSRHDTLYLAGNIMNDAELQDEAAARRAIGLDCAWHSKQTMQDEWNIPRAAIHTHGSIAVDPRRMTAGLLRAAMDRGMRLYSPATVQDIEPVPGGVILHTEQGPAVRATTVICTTGYETLRGLYKNRRFKIISSWAIATKQQPRKIWRDAAHIWEASDPYLYIRSTPDGRVLCGGEDEEFSNETARDALIPAKARRLQEKLGKLLPELNTRPVYKWAGCFGQTPTSLPLIGAVPDKENCLAVLAYGGNGITFARVAAEMLATHLAGGMDSDADIFAL